jgi:hypothetical protein
MFCVKQEAPRCYANGDRCIGAPGMPYVPYAPCCDGECVETSQDWGRFCVQTTRPATTTAHATAASVATATYVSTTIASFNDATRSTMAATYPASIVTTSSYLPSVGPTLTSTVKSQTYPEKTIGGQTNGASITAPLPDNKTHTVGPTYALTTTIAPVLNVDTTIAPPHSQITTESPSSTAPSTVFGTHGSGSAVGPTHSLHTSTSSKKYSDLCYHHLSNINGPHVYAHIDYWLAYLPCPNNHGSVIRHSSVRSSDVNAEN